MSASKAPDLLSQSPMIKIVVKSMASPFAQDLANLLSAKGFSRSEVDALLSQLKGTGMLPDTVNAKRILSSLGRTAGESAKTAGGEKTRIPPLSVAKFKAKTQSFSATSPLPPPRAEEDRTRAMFRVALPFYRAISAGKGPQYNERKPSLLGWIRELLGDNPPSKVERETQRRNRFEGFSTRELAFPPPLDPALQRTAVQRMEAQLKALGLDVSLARDAVAFYFNQANMLTLDYFEELYHGVCSLRLKLTAELERPGSQTFSDQDVKQLSQSLNMTEQDLTEMLKEREDQARIRDALVVLEYAHENIEAAYEHQLGYSIHPELAMADAIGAGVDVAEAMLVDGAHPEIAYGVASAKPVTPENTAAPAA